MILLRPWWLAALPLLMIAGLMLWRRGADAGGWQAVMPPQMLGAMVALGWMDGGGRAGRMVPLGAALALVLGLAGPALPRADAPVFAQGDAVLLAVDMSPSITGGVQAQALADAQAGAAQVIAGLAGRPVGLILYAGEAYLAAAPTTDPQVLDSLIAVLDPQTMPDRGSNPAAAMALAGQMLAGTPRADLVLIGDGGGTDSPAAQAEATRLSDAGIGLWALRVTGDPPPASERLTALATSGIAPATAPGPVIAGLTRAGLGGDPAMRVLRYRDLGPWLAALAMLALLTQFRRRA